MKITSITSALAGALLLLVNFAIADDEAAGAKVSHPVLADHAKNATLWDFHGNELGEIEDIVLSPGEAGALAVINTSILDDKRKIVVPWKVIQVQTKKTDADDVIYALDANKAKLMAAPQYNGELTSLAGTTMACCTYWDKDLKGTIKRSAKEVGKEVKEAVKEVKKAAQE